MRITGVLVIAAIVSLTGAARADEPDAPPPAAEPPVIVAPAADPQPVLDAFDRAFDDLFARRYADAATGFDHVATTSVDPQRRASATELARRAHVMAERALRAAPIPDKSRDGRYGLLIGSSLAGLALYGPTVVSLESGSDPKVQVGTYMLAAGASFFLPYLATSDEPVTWGMTDAFWYGATRGAYHGAMFVEMFHQPNTSASSQEILGTMSLGSILEGAGGTYWAARTHASAGLTNAMSKGGDYGALYGIAIASIAMPSNNQDSRALAAGGLIGSAAGIYGGYLLAEHRDLTWGDSEVMRAAVSVGIGAAAVPLVLAETDNHRIILPTLMVGAAAGFVVGDRLLDGHDFSAGQGVVTELSTFAGAGIGLGLAYLVSPDHDSSTRDKMLIVGTVLGGTGGFVLAYLGLDTTVGRTGPTATPVTVQIVPQITPDQKGVVVAGTF